MKKDENAAATPGAGESVRVRTEPVAGSVQRLKVCRAEDAHKLTIYENFGNFSDPFFSSLTNCFF